jgi:phosphopantothenoylcysteine decarboxylase/phosphopantothenate--cysteine ligase
MWQHPATQGSVEKLKSWGVRVVEPEAGLLACGDTGAGRLADPEKIAAEIIKTVKKG